MTSEIVKRGIIAIGVAENVYRNIKTEQQYVLRCRKRSILDNERLKNCWQRQEKNKTLVVAEFLYNYSFNENIITESKIRQCGVNLMNIHHQIPLYITKEQYKQIINGTEYAQRVDFD